MCRWPVILLCLPRSGWLTALVATSCVGHVQVGQLWQSRSGPVMSGHGQWSISWSVAMVMVSGNGHGQWSWSWSVVMVMVCGHGHPKMPCARPLAALCARSHAVLCARSHAALCARLRAVLAVLCYAVCAAPYCAALCARPRSVPCAWSLESPMLAVPLHRLRQWVCPTTRSYAAVPRTQPRAVSAAPCCAVLCVRPRAVLCCTLGPVPCRALGPCCAP
eukprot:SAG31_NODE_5314_length_2613_cov_4.902148_1_plen_219_part_00